MKRPPEPREQDVPRTPGEEPTNSLEEQEIDRILADSFPASDAPPWTLGVTPVPTEQKRTRRNNRK